MKKIIMFIAVTGFLIPTVVFAKFDVSQIIAAIGKIYGVNLELKDFNKQLVDGLIGTHSYGTNHYDPDTFNWGGDTSTWQRMLDMAKNQESEGEIGNAIRTLTRQFPMEDEKVSNNELENKYYLLQAQTNIAARASSQVTFQQLNTEANTLKALHRLIDETKDNKSAVDLSNRLNAEQTNVSIQQTKLLAILVEQAGVAAQEKSNRAVENKQFFDM